MSRRVNKKRKLNDASSEATSISSEDYTFKPFSMRTIHADLEAIPHDILVRSLIQSSRTDAKFLGTLNKSIEHVLDSESSSEEEEADDLVEKNSKPNAYEYRQYSPTKIRKYVNYLFDNYKWRPPNEAGMWNDWIPETDHRERTYNLFISLLNKLLNKAKHLAAAGENASAFIILNVLESEATLNRFDNNGDLSIDEDNEDAEELDIDMTPEEFVDDLETILEEVSDQLSDAEMKYCQKKLKGYEATLPNKKHNEKAFKAFPLNEGQIRSKFDDKSFSRAQGYIGMFKNIRSIIQNKQKVYEIHAKVDAVSMSGEYYQMMEFNNKRLIDSDCSCPVGYECKHLAALMLQIKRTKKHNRPNNRHFKFVELL